MSSEFGIDAAEALVRSRMETAVNGVSPDLVGLVGGGIERGRVGLRRRRRTTGVGLAAALAVLLGSLSYAGAHGLFDREPGPTNNGQVGQLVNATPRGMAAAVLTHVQALGSTAGVAGEESISRDRSRSLTAEVAMTTTAGDDVEFYVVATNGIHSLAGFSCHPPRTDLKGGTCQQLHFETGPRAFYVEKQGIAGGRPTVLTSLTVLRHGQLVRVIQTVIGSSDPVLDDTNLYNIATDPLVGLTTTAELNARGEQLQGFKNGDLLTRVEHGGSGSSPAPVTSGTPATATVHTKR